MERQSFQPPLHDSVLSNMLMLKHLLTFCIFFDFLNFSLFCLCPHFALENNQRLGWSAVTASSALLVWSGWTYIVLLVGPARVLLLMEESLLLGCLVVFLLLFSTQRFPLWAEDRPVKIHMKSDIGSISQAQQISADCVRPTTPSPLFPGKHWRPRCPGIWWQASRWASAPSWKAWKHLEVSLCKPASSGAVQSRFSFYRTHKQRVNVMWRNRKIRSRPSIRDRDSFQFKLIYPKLFSWWWQAIAGGVGGEGVRGAEKTAAEPDGKFGKSSSNL